MKDSRTCDFHHPGGECRPEDHADTCNPHRCAKARNATAKRGIKIVRVKESDCILPSEEHFDAGVHPAVLLDVLATSLLSTSIDSSTGAAWRYDKRLYVTPRIKDTPECRRWLENEVKTMSETVESKPSEIDSTVNPGGYAYREDAERHPVGYADQIEKKISPEKNNEGEEAQTSHATIKNK